MRFTAKQYDLAIEALFAARNQLDPDGLCCRVCMDTGHQAWECGHNPLLAMAMCERTARRALDLHDRIHAIEDKMNDEDQSDALAEWREDAHDLMHFLAGFDQQGPAHVVPSQEEVSP